MRLEKLPKWVVSNEESVWRETERARRMTPEERGLEVHELCGIVAAYWEIPGYAERIRNASDPVSPETARKLAELRERYRRERAR